MILLYFPVSVLALRCKCWNSTHFGSKLLMYTEHEPAESPFKTGSLGDINLMPLVLIKGPAMSTSLPPSPPHPHTPPRRRRQGATPCCSGTMLSSFQCGFCRSCTSCNQTNKRHININMNCSKNDNGNDNDNSTP